MEPHHPFDDPFADEPDEQQPKPAPRVDEAGTLLDYLHTIVLSRDPKGRLPTAKTVAVRWCILRRLLGRGNERSLAADAADIGCTRQCLSKLGGIIAAKLNMRGSWMRVDAREVYRERALAVHRGEWVASDKWIRRKRREAAEKLEAEKGSRSGRATG
jgi:hypothetical protein